MQLMEAYELLKKVRSFAKVEEIISLLKDTYKDQIVFKVGPALFNKNTLTPCDPMNATVFYFSAKVGDDGWYLATGELVSERLKDLI